MLNIETEFNLTNEEIADKIAYELRDRFSSDDIDVAISSDSNRIIVTYDIVKLDLFISEFDKDIESNSSMDVDIVLDNMNINETFSQINKLLSYKETASEILDEFKYICSNLDII